MPCFSTRVIVSFDSPSKGKKKRLYEERITFWTARNESSAIKKSEKEVLRYAKESGGRYLGFIQCYQPDIDVGFEGVEIFSLIRESDLSPTKYINRFFETGTERQRT